MFLTTSGFKRLLKRAYSGAGLSIGNTGAGIYLSGGYWTIFVKKGEIPRKKLAAIIELVGELPEPGTGYRITKGNQQYELTWNELYNALDNARSCECEEELETTKIIIESGKGTLQRVIQHPESGCTWIVNEEFIQMLDNKEVDEHKGHTEAYGPVAGRYPGVFWFNNAMALHVIERKDDESEELRKYLGHFNINGDRYEWTDVPEDDREEKEKETQKEHPA